MTEPALARYLQTCCRRLNQQQQALIDDFSLRTCAAIEVQQSLGGMTLDLPGRGRAIATVTPLARYRPSHQIWSWAWAASEPFPMASHGAIALKSLASKTGLELFETAEFQLPLEPVSLLLAMACSRLKASGYYRWPDGEEFVFLAINHLALATAPLAYDRNGDRLQLVQLNSPQPESQTQVSQLLHPLPSLWGDANSAMPLEAGEAIAWPHQRCVEGLFVHTLYPGHLSDLERSLTTLKCLRGNGYR